MRCSMARSLLEGILRYKEAPHFRTVPRFNNAKETKSIRMTHSITKAHLFSNTEERSTMMTLWPDLVIDLTEGERYPDIPEATKWMAEVLQYNVARGKQHRGLTIIHAYRMLADPEQLTEENLKLARILAWCQEINQSFLLMQDDLVDCADTRRGQLCWHLRDNIGITAVNDSIILEHATYQLLRTYFNKHRCYLNLLETFTETTLRIALGQVLDIFTSNYGHCPDMDLFTLDRYKRFTKHSGAHYFYLMPVKLAMYLAGITDPEMYRQTEPILLDLGHLYMMQNDYLDSYGDPNITGKSGTDIKGGKCSWLIVTALQHATPRQRKILQEYYGYEDPEKVARVKQVYDELDLPRIYVHYEEKAYHSLKTRIKQISCDFPKELFDVLMELGQD